MKIKRILLISLMILVIGFFCVSLILDKNANQSTLTLRAQEGFRLHTEQVALKLQNWMAKSQYALTGCAAAIGDMTEGDDLSDILLSLKTTADSMGFDDVMYCDVKGNGTSLDETVHAVGFCPYYQRALLGDVTIAKTGYFESDGETTSYVLTVPVKQSGMITGVLRARLKDDQIVTKLSISEFRGNEGVYLLNRNADILDSSEPKLEMENLLELFKEDSEEYLMFEQAIRQGRSLFCTVEKEYIGCSGIPESGEWAIIVRMNLETLETFYREAEIEANQRSAFILQAGILLFACAVIAFAVMESATRYRMQRLAYYDEITGSMNYNFFCMNCNQFLLKNSGSSSAMIEIGVTKYDYLKDFFGEKEMERLLKEIATVLDSNMKKNEFYCHHFAEVFYIFVQFYNQEELKDRIHYMNESIEAVNKVEGEKNKYSLSVAWGICCGEKEKNDTDTMIARASLAYLTSKGDRNTNVSFYTDKMQNRMLDEREIEHDMYEALEHREFLVYLQPKFDLNTGKQVGGEALVRWMHPEKGLMYPGRFISTFEKNGFIVKLDMYILEELCRRIKVWISKGYRPFPLSLNISRLNLYDQEFLSEAERIADAYGIPHYLIIFEISEEVVAENLEKLSEVMTRLRDMDFIVSMDDFGTGGTSMNTLYYVPVNELKIDRKFLLNAEKTDRGQNVIGSIIEMAKRLDIKVVSEGVENKQQALLLRELGCDMIQGFAFSEPLPEHEYDEYAYGSRAKENTIW